jgi:hypothetical protein
VTSTLGISQAKSVDLLPPTLQTVPEAIGRNIANIDAFDDNSAECSIFRLGPRSGPQM